MKRLILILLLFLLAGPVLGASYVEILNTTHDGTLGSGNTNVTSATVFRQNGVTGTFTGTSGNTGLTANTADGYYLKYERAAYSFNLTNASGKIMTSAVFRFCPWTAGSRGLGNVSYTLTSGTEYQSNGTLLALDYKNVTNTPLTDTNFTQPEAAACKNVTLNSAGLLRLNSTNYVPIYIRMTPDVDNSTSGTPEGITWSASATSLINVAYNEQSSNANKPKLYITYQDNVNPPTSAFSANITTARAPADVVFTDASTNTPTSWSWAYKNETTGWTVFSTDQNPTQTFPLGNYSINLTATNDGGSDDEVKEYYIHSNPFPTANFTGDPVEGNRPLTVVFTDSSDSAGTTTYAWDFGDLDTTNNTEKNPVHTYNSVGIFTVSLNVSNTSGYDKITRAGYINVTAPTTPHPSIVFPRQSPGFLNVSIEPWASANTTMYASVATGLSTDYTTSTSSNRAAYAKIMGVAYQFTGNTNYANKTVEALLWMNNSLDCLYLGDYAVGYDLIHQTKNANSSLDTINDTLVRDRLAIAADSCYFDQNQSPHTAVSLVDMNGKIYPQIATIGLVLEDYSNSSLNTTPVDWAYLGGGGLWESDPLHTESHVIADGLMAEGIDNISGHNRVGSYKYYIDALIYPYMHYYTAFYGANYFTAFPKARDWSLQETWQVLPMNVLPSHQTDGNVVRLHAKLLYGLHDATNKSILKRQIELMESATVTYENPPKSLGVPTGADIILFLENTSTVSPQSPSYTSRFTGGGYNVFRKDWTTTSDWLGFTVWNGTATSNRITAHSDTLSFEYASHGDLLLIDSGEVKYLPYETEDWRVYGYYPFMHNSMLVDQETNFTRASFAKGNLTYRGFAKSNTRQGITNTLIKTPAVEYMDGTIQNADIQSTTEGLPSSATLSPGVNVSRAILYPTKDYMVVVDRGESSGNYYYIPTFHFGSLKLTGNSSVIDNDLTHLQGLGKVNGTLKINDTVYDWAGKNVSLELPTGYTANNVSWNTTSPYGDDVTLDMFAVPAAPVSVMKFVTRISTYSALAGLGQWTTGGDTLHNIDSVFSPHIFFKTPDPATTSYRLTLLNSRYSNTSSTYTPLQLSVTGAGGAMKVTHGTITDSLYTGTGTSQFDDYSTTADTVFIRVNSTVTDYTVINATNLTKSGKPLFNSTTRLSYAAYNKSGTTVMLNVSGSGSSKIAVNVSGTASDFKIDDVAAESSQTGDTLTFTTSLSDHGVSWEEGSGAGPSAAGTFDPISIIKRWLRKIRHSIGLLGYWISVCPQDGIK